MNSIRTRFKDTLVSFYRLPNAIKQSFADTYYPELTRKKAIERIWDNIAWCLKYHEANLFYTLYGMDVIERRSIVNDYLDYRSFMLERDIMNKNDNSSSQTAILRDKFLFFQYMTSMKLPTAEVFGLLLRGRLYDISVNHINENSLIDKTDYFVKELNGECGSFVLHIKDYDDFCQKKDEIFQHDCILQYSVYQCHDMNTLNPRAVNTVRLVTVNSLTPSVFSAELRIGTLLTGAVDNAAAGGILVGINEAGYLKSFGICKYGNTKRVNIHPDTGRTFEGFRVPFYEDICKLACYAHSKYYGIHSIGWDVAVTENGPVFIEGNDNWEISGLQAANGGLRSKWNLVCQ